MKKKIIIAISGGVDSTVAAILLKKYGYNVEGIFMKNWEEEDNIKYCNSYIDYNDANLICNRFNITLHNINFSYEYWKKVFVNFIHDYKIGKTPNPDIICNKEIKFKLLLKHVINNLKCDFLATGHYVRKIYYKSNFYLKKGVDNIKDQSYFLYKLSNKELSKVLFPLGNYTKTYIRKIANSLNLLNANKKSSVGICFIGKRKFSKFIKKFIPDNNGNILNINNIKLGKHKGIFYYTIGQRISINNNYLFNKKNKPWYVIKKDVINNNIIVHYGYHNKYLLSKGVIIYNFYWNNNLYKELITNKNIIYCSIKLRHSNKIIKIKLLINNKKKYLVKIKFLEKVYSVAIGQSIVVYYTNICLGGGIISKNYNFF